MNTKIKILGWIFLSLLLFTGCKDEEPREPTQTRIATVENPDEQYKFTFILDNGTRMWTESTRFGNYQPKSGQRIIANYSIIEKKNNAGYDYDVKLQDIYEVLTKEIFNVTTESQQDSIGNDAIFVEDMWIGNEYLNVEFVYRGDYRTHFINLIYDSEKTYNDNKIHLEFRHNANGDYPAYNGWGVASFNLRTLKENVMGDSIDIVVHSKEYSSSEKKREFTYKFSSEVRPNERSISVQTVQGDFK